VSEAPSPTLDGVPRPALPAVVLTAFVAAAGRDVGSEEQGAPTERPREADSRSESGPAPLADRLRRGGYVLTFRHAATDFSTADRTRNLRDCSRQRNLTAEGRREPGGNYSEGVTFPKTLTISTSVSHSPSALW
jgi:hypothetical protein